MTWREEIVEKIKLNNILGWVCTQSILIAS